MGDFSGVNKHSQSGGGNYWKPGKYLAEIEAVKYINRFKGKSYIIEAKVLESSVPEIKVGDTCSQVIKLDKPNALGNIASFMRVCQAIMTGESLEDPEKLEVEESDVEASYGEDQPLVGIQVEIDAILITTAAGKPFTKIVYKVPESLKSQAA